MSKNRFDNNMVGDNGDFQPTRWTDIERAMTENPERKRIAEDLLIKRYWKPVYCYLRCKGYSNENAEDLTQGFFYEIVLGRDLFCKADRNKGKFRTILLTALDNYVISEHRKETAQKRHPEKGLVEFDTSAMENCAQIEMNKTPEEMFNYAWATVMLDRALNQLEEELLSANQEKHWKLFVLHEIDPIKQDKPKPSLSELCKKLVIESKKKASNMLITVKRRFAKIIKRLLDDEDFQDFMAILN